MITKWTTIIGKVCFCSVSNIWYIWILLALEHVCYWHLAIEIYLLAMSSTSWMKVSWRNNWNIFQQKFTASVALFEILHSVLFKRSFFNLRKNLLVGRMTICPSVNWNICLTLQVRSESTLSKFKKIIKLYYFFFNVV